MWTPDWATTPPDTAAGSFSSTGLVCHGTTAPAGAGQGRLSLVAGHQLMGDSTL